MKIEKKRMNIVEIIRFIFCRKEVKEGVKKWIKIILDDIVDIIFEEQSESSHS